MGISLRARRGGYVAYPGEEEQLKGDIWVRRGESWGKWWRRVRGERKEFEVEEVDDGSTRETSRMWWNGEATQETATPDAERIPLLGSR
jgi:hypothetical protein